MDWLWKLLIIVLSVIGGGLFGYALGMDAERSKERNRHARFHSEDRPARSDRG